MAVGRAGAALPPRVAEDNPAGPQVERRAAARRADKLEALEIQESGITRADVTQMMSEGATSRISLAIKVDSSSFSNRR